MRTSLVLICLALFPALAHARQAGDTTIAPTKPSFQEGESLRFAVTNQKPGETRPLVIVYATIEKSGRLVADIDELYFDTAAGKSDTLQLDPLNGEDDVILSPGTYQLTAHAQFEEPDHETRDDVTLTTEFQVVSRTLGVVFRTSKAKYTIGEPVVLRIWNGTRKTWYQDKDSRHILKTDPIRGYTTDTYAVARGRNGWMLPPKGYQTWTWSSKKAEPGPYFAHVALYSGRNTETAPFFWLRKKFELTPKAGN